MTEIPDVQYAKSGDVSIAYQVIGSGPTDVVFVRGFTGDLLSAWDTSSLSGLYALQLQVIRSDQRVDTAIIQVTVKP